MIDMSEIDLASLPDDTTFEFNFAELGWDDPDSPESIGKMLEKIAISASMYAEYRVLSSALDCLPRDQISENIKGMKRSCANAKLWFEESASRLKKLTPESIKNRIPDSGSFLAQAGICAKELVAYIHWDLNLFPELWKFAIDSYIEPGSPGWNYLKNPIRDFSNNACSIQDKIREMGSLLSNYADKLQQVVIVEVAHIDASIINRQSNEVTDGKKSNEDEIATTKNLPKPCQLLAWASYQWICDTRPDLVDENSKGSISRDQWEYIKDHGCPSYEGLRVPDYQTWARYIRGVRQFNERQISPLDADFRQGKSVINQNQI